jgi:hypothetical protein
MDCGSELSMNTFRHCEQSDVIHVPGLRGLPRYARSDGVRFKVRVRYRAGFGGLAMTAI